MKEAEQNIGNQPYSEISQQAKIKAALLEVPSGATTLCKRLLQNDRLTVDEAQSVLFEATEALSGSAPFGLKSSPKITGHLGQGFESTGFIFDTKEGKWVIKIGLPKNCVSGVYSPSTNKYASTMVWNYRALMDTFQEKLPHVTPSPYFVIPPSGLSRHTTVQIQPYIQPTTNADNLTNSQREDLIAERTTFYYLSRSMLKHKRVMPDLVKRKNLIVGTTSGQAHYTLVDVGLFHLQAPTPVLNILVFFSQRLSLSRDLRALKSRR